MCLSFARNCSSTNQSKYLWRLPSFSVMPFFKGFFLWYTFPAKRKITCNLVCRSVDIKQLIIWAPKKEIVVCLNIRYIKIPWKIKMFFSKTISWMYPMFRQTTINQILWFMTIHVIRHWFYDQILLSFQFQKQMQ